MDARLFDGAFSAGDPHALRAAAPGSVRAHSLGGDRDGDRLARGDRRRRTIGRAGGRRDPRSLLTTGSAFPSEQVPPLSSTETSLMVSLRAAIAMEPPETSQGRGWDC